MSRQDIRQYILAVLIASLAVTGTAAIVGFAVSGFFTASSGVTIGVDSGPEVTLSQQLDIEGDFGETFNGDSAVNISTNNNGWIVFSAPSTATGTLDTISDAPGFTNVSSIGSGNLTIQPDDKNFTTAGGGVTEIKFKEVKVNDGTTDFFYSGTGTGTIVVETNATHGTAYGMVNQETNEGLDVAVAQNDGTVHFTEVPSASNTEVRIEELGTLTIREETPNHPKITSATTTIKFFEDEEEDPTIVERTTNNGEIDLTGLPVDEKFSVSISAPGYHNRTVILNDLSQQENVFLLSKDRTSIENRFTVLDRTGEFPPEDTEIIIEKTINRSLYGGDPPEFTWTAIGGDDLGADEAYVIDLEEEDRYRIRVRNAAGDERVLGAYTPETSGTIELKIGSVVNDPEAENDVGWAANRTNRTGESVMVNFEYNDTTDTTNTIWLEIFEYNNQSNVLLANTSFTGPFGTFTNSETVPDADNNTAWVVKWTAERDGDNAQARVVVGPEQSALDDFTDMPDWLLAIIFVGSTLMIVGLFSQLNGAVGGIAGASWASMLWFAGMVPDVVGSGVIALALVTAGVMYVRERRGGL